MLATFLRIDYRVMGKVEAVRLMESCCNSPSEINGGWEQGGNSVRW